MNEKPNPFALKRPSRTIRDLVLTDSNQPEIVIKMRVRALDVLDGANADSLAKELVATYITGNTPFPPIDGEALVLNPELILSACTIYFAQCGSDDDKFTVEELIAFTVTLPEIWQQLVATCSMLIDEGPLGKTLRMEILPAYPSLDTQKDIQN